jgi:hypothetical protein
VFWFGFFFVIVLEFSSVSLNISLCLVVERDIMCCLITSLIKERFVTSEVMASVCFLEKREHPVISLFTRLESSQTGGEIPEVREISAI